MGKKVAPLTVAAIKAAPIGKRLFDGEGLVMEIRENAIGKYPYALLRYQDAAGRRREYGIGVVDVGTPASRGGRPLATENSENGRTEPSVREQARELKRQVRDGKDPIQRRKQEKQAWLASALVPAAIPTFTETLCRYVEKESPTWTSARYARGWAKAVEDHAEKLLPLRVDVITHQMVVKALAPCWAAPPVTGQKVRARVEAILTYATAQGWRSGPNPAALSMIRDLMPKVEKAKTEVQHMPAARWQDIGAIMVALEKVETTGALAARFAILTAARAEEVRDLIWTEVDTSSLRSVVLVDEDGQRYEDTTGAVWVVPAKRMKGRREHRVPLAAEALTILQTMRRLYPDAKNSDPVFPGRNGKSRMDVATQRYALAAAGASGLSMHGMRACFRSWAGEATHYDRMLAEFALAHRVHGATERAYARGTLFGKRRKLMDAWARFCTRPLRQAEGENVVALQTAAAAR